jgi:hypothetical protein
MREEPGIRDDVPKPAGQSQGEAEEKAPAPVARKLSEIVRPSEQDPDELLRYRFLCRLGALLLCGPTGIGKSSLALNLALLWAVGRDGFGIKPARALRSLFIQAENDDGDLAEMRDGIIAGLNFTPEQTRQATGSVVVAREDERVGKRFFLETVQPLLEAHKPDLLWIDPALSYLGGETNSQRDVGAFLRNGLNPLLRRYNCGAVVVHHTNKPPQGHEKPTWTGGDFAYLGAGSAEWANWARAVLALRSIGQHPVYELRAAKRGGRLGWQMPEGASGFVKYLSQAAEPGAICWREVQAPELSTGGRPKSATENDLLSLLPEAGMKTGEWRTLADAERGISKTSFFRLLKILEQQKRVFKSKISEAWQPILKR